MADSTAKLAELRINRERSRKTGTPHWIWWSAGAVVCFAIVAGIWTVAEPGSPAATAVAAPSSPVGAGDAAANSLLDASGYVVARRQATVSSKITGRLVEVLV